MEIELSLELYKEVPTLLSDKEWRLLKQKVDLLQNSIPHYEFFNDVLKKLSSPPEMLRLGIIMTEDKNISTLNRQYRGKNGPTDVITFPFHFSPEEHTDFPTGNSAQLEAEIYISQERAREQALERSHSLLHELLILLVHGVVHAFGLDHENSPEEAKTMKSFEARLLSSIGLHHTEPLTQ